MRRLIVTLGSFGILAGAAGCYVHDRAPARYGYAPAPGPRHEWRAEERHERHEAREHERGEWRAPEDHD
jgi:hypothetical protein